MTDAPGGPSWLNGDTERLQPEGFPPPPPGGVFSPPPVDHSAPEMQFDEDLAAHHPDGPLPLFATDTGAQVQSEFEPEASEPVASEPIANDSFNDLLAAKLTGVQIGASAEGVAGNGGAKPSKPPKTKRSKAPKKGGADQKSKAKNPALPKLLALLGVVVVLAGVFVFLQGRGGEDGAIDVADPTAPVEQQDAATTEVDAVEASDSTVADADAPAAASGDAQENARVVLAEVWANADEKRSAHAHLLAAIDEMGASGDISAVRVAAAAAANAYTAEAALWDGAAERIATLEDPYRTSLLMLKRANEVMLAGAQELTTCEQCSAADARALALNGERLTSDGMADIIAILPPVQSDA